MSGAAAPGVLRLTPAFDWRDLDGGAGTAPFVGAGGVQVQARRQTMALAALGVPQTVLSLPPPGGPAEVRLGEGVVLRGVAGRALTAPGREPGPIGRQLAWGRGVRTELRRRPPAAEVIHVHGTCAPWPLRVALAAQRRLRLPLVVTVHCSINATYTPASRRDAAFQHYARSVERTALARSERTLVLTRGVRERLLAAGLGAPERVGVMPDLVDVAGLRGAATPAAARRFAERHDVPADRPVVLYLGRLSPEKGTAVLVELARALGERGGAQLVVCGGGEDESTLRDELRARGLDGVATLTGELPSDEVPGALARADALVLPSTFEELGSVVLEAAAVGVPVAAFAAGGVAEAVRDGETGLLAPAGDVAALVRAVSRLVDDVALAARLGEAAAQRAHEFDQEARARELLEIYRVAVAG